MKSGTHYGPEQIELISVVLAAVWDSLPIISRRHMSKAIIAERIMVAVNGGEQDRITLRAAALQPKVIPMVFPTLTPRK